MKVYEVREESSNPQQCFYYIIAMYKNEEDAVKKAAEMQNTEGYDDGWGVRIYYVVEHSLL